MSDLPAFGRDYGGVPVSTGALKRTKRADAPDILKTGNLLKLSDNDNLELAAA